MINPRAARVLPLTPRRAAYLVTGVVALWFSYDLLRMPVQVSDSLVELLDVQQSPSLSATFVAAANRSAYLRPLRLVQIKALFDLADGHYWLVYRGFHALLLGAGLLLFTRALRVRTWADFAAAVFALTVLTGLHTFRGTVREAFPINHFLEVSVFCLIALNLSQSKGGWWVDVAAAVTFVVASLTIESGLLVWVVVAAAWACGMRGVSRRGLVAVTVLLGAYFWVRFWYLSVGTPGLEERSSGFLLAILEPEELAARFGSNLMWFYAYNVATSMLSVLFSDPDGGVFAIPRAWLQGDVPPRLYLAFVSSVMATALIGWAAVARLRDRARQVHGANDHLLVIAGAVLVANSAISFAYTKHETISVAGAFYAFAAFVGARHAMEYVRVPASSTAGIVIVVMLAATATMWAFRSAGVHHMLRVQAFKVRNDWVWVSADRMRDSGSEEARLAAALVRQLRHDALEMRVANPYLLPRWADRWWGD
jgi:hypothetical protein